MTQQMATKQARLRRMRWLASSLLGAMVVLLLLSHSLQSAYPWLQWVRAFAEAGAVGALADWYAVVALFRRPLGLPLPHSAIVASNKDRIGESLGAFVEQNFLTPENIVERLAEHNTAKALAEWLANGANSRQVAAVVAGLTPGALNAIEDEDVRGFIDRTLTPQLLKLNFSGMAAKVLSALTEDNRHQALLDRGLRLVDDWLAANQGLIKAKVSEVSRYTPGFIDSFIVGRFVDGIRTLLHEIAINPHHELRLQFDNAVRDLIAELETSADYRKHGQALMREIVEHLTQESYYRYLWDKIRLRLQADLDSSQSLVRGYMADATVVVAKELLAEPAVQRKLNAWWLSLAEKLVQRYRHQISALITSVVKSWDAEEVATKLELEIGPDLQYIRINGTLVGGMAGILLHTLTYILPHAVSG
jgi:uncharacterized membrane-anchored protein YjiN (DUF445 family)